MIISILTQIEILFGKYKRNHDCSRHLLTIDGDTECRHISKGSVWEVLEEVNKYSSSPNANITLSKC